MDTVKDMLNNCNINGEWYPLPDWASDYNYTLEPVAYAQLFTLNGRRTGNAVISDVYNTDFGKIYVIVTDMGNVIRASIDELFEMFEIGIYLIKQEGIERRLNNQQQEESYDEKAKT